MPSQKQTVDAQDLADLGDTLLRAELARAEKVIAVARRANFIYDVPMLNEALAEYERNLTVTPYHRRRRALTATADVRMVQHCAICGTNYVDWLYNSEAFRRENPNADSSEAIAHARFLLANDFVECRLCEKAVKVPRRRQPKLRQGPNYG